MRSTGLVLLVYCFANAQAEVFQPSPNTQKCQPVTIPMCIDIPYNMTMMPNLLSHSTQEEASQALAQFNPLIKVKCSEDIKLFLCTLHAPLCTPVLNSIIEPCRHLCLSAKRGCESLMIKFGFRWPEQMDCSRFPENFCVGENRTSSSWKGEPLECPSSMRSAPNLNYVLTTSTGSMDDCSLPCDEDNVVPVFLTSKEKKVVRVWTGAWALASLVCSIFTIITFLIDLPRFCYPVRPIVYMALCYLAISSVYLIGVTNGDKYACEKEKEREDSGALVSQRLTHLHCTLMALIYHFALNASCAWWMVLCVSWFLSARLHWGNESIASFSLRFHLLAWGVPALLSVALLITESVDGDVITGICSVGNVNSSPLFLFVVVPQTLAIVVGVILLLLGVCSMLRIRSYYKVRESVVEGEVGKLERLMMRIVVFALFYTAPTIASVCLSTYQAWMSPEWMSSLYAQRCRSTHRSLYGFIGGRESCPALVSHTHQPDVVFFAAKSLCQLMVGVTCAVWVVSAKTMQSYHKASARLCGGGGHSHPAQLSQQQQLHFLHQHQPLHLHAASHR